MENITFDDFKKIDFRVAQIKEAQDVEGADRLFQLKVEVGGEERQLIAGIKGHYTNCLLYTSPSPRDS